jgi:hypothetical protein
MLFTLQATALSEVLETVAAKVSVSPRNTVPLRVMLMVMMHRGGGGGITEPAPSPPQPSVHAPTVRRMLTNAR